MAVVLPHPVRAELPAGYAEKIQPTLETFCVGCHNQDSPEAEVRLDYQLNQIDLGRQHEMWRAVAEKLESGEMPPEDEPQPTTEERAALIAWVTACVESIDCGEISSPGVVTIHRLNRREYNNTVRDLVGLDLKLADNFPADDVGGGFDNISDVLSLPPLLMEMYLDAADSIVTRILENEEARERLIVQPSDDVPANTAARQTLTRFASRAYRRPVREAELAGLMSLYLDAEGSYLERVGLPMSAVLCSSQFLFRSEITTDAETAEDDPVRDLNGHELASRLSYFLWSSMPDDPLLAAADQGQILSGEARRATIQRMLKDPKAESLIENFVGQWLQLRNLEKITPNPEQFPSFSDELRNDMLRETQLFAREIMFEDRSVLEFLDSDYTFLNARLAEHYGINGVTGNEFQKVSLDDPRRGGILTHGSILTLTSNPTRTSPVKRGKWIMDNLLGTPPPPPPPGVEELADEDETELLGSLRERMEQHRADPNCAVCHKKMDALGFGFENFDAVGVWRDKDGRFAIDPAGALPGNQEFQGPSELRKILRNQRRDEFVRCLAEKMLTYALGRELQSFDRCAVDDIVKAMSENEYRFSSLIVAIVESDPFRKRGFKGTPQ